MGSIHARQRPVKLPQLFADFPTLVAMYKSFRAASRRLMFALNHSRRLFALFGVELIFHV